MWAMPQDCAGRAGRHDQTVIAAPVERRHGAGILRPWADPEHARRAFEAIDRDYGPWPELRLMPKGPKGESETTFYPRHAAHALLGLAIDAYR